MKRIVILILVLLASLLSGCVSVPMATFEQDAKAKQFTPDPDKASLYIYRNEMLSTAIPLTVDVNDIKLGESVSQSYFLVRLAPGNYTIAVHAKNADGLTKSNDSSLTVSVEAGKNYFVWQDVGVGLLFAHNSLQTVDETTGRAGVNESKLVANAIADTSITASKTGSAAGANGSSSGVQGVIFGTSAVTVEKLAMKRNCQPVTGASLLFKNGPIEDYRVKCSDGSEIGAHCEYRQCLLK